MTFFLGVVIGMPGELSMICICFTSWELPYLVSLLCPCISVPMHSIFWKLSEGVLDIAIVALLMGETHYMFSEAGRPRARYPKFAGKYGSFFTICPTDALFSEAPRIFRGFVISGVALGLFLTTGELCLLKTVWDDLAIVYAIVGASFTVVGLLP